jgi:hypothetical protein
MDPPKSRLTDPALALTVLATVALGVVALARRAPNTDTLWLVDVARRMRDGQVLYRDILEINPPLILWLLYPIAKLPHAAEVYRGLVGLLALAVSAWIAGRLRRPWAVVPLLVVLGVLPSGWFAERDHVTVLLVLPWLVATLTGGASLLLGVIAGLGFSLKPHHLVALACVLPIIRFDRSLAGLLATGVVYVLSVLACTEYLRLAVVLGHDYTLYRPAGLASLLWANPCTWLAVLGPAAWLLVGRRSHPLERGLALATVGFLGGAVLQGKGWNYHYAPAMVTSLLLLVSVAAGPRAPRLVPVWAVLAFVLAGMLRAALRPEPSHHVEVTARLRRDLPGTPRAVLALYDHEGWAFGLTAFDDARFVSPFPCLWIFSTPVWRDRLPWWTAQLVRAAERDPPDLVLVYPNVAGPLLGDSTFARWLARYKPAPEAGGYRVYVRR